MSLYLGKNSEIIDLIANNCKKSDVIDVIKRYFMPMIGTIKYLSRKDKINITGLTYDSTIGAYVNKNDDFRGWVYANGELFDKDVFSNAYEVFNYKFGGSGQYFKIPTLDDFIKISLNNIYNIDKQSQKSFIESHQHNINTTITTQYGGVIENAFTFVTTPNPGVVGLMNKVVDGEIQYELDKKGKETKIPVSYNTKEDGLQDKITNPEYNNYYPVFHNGSGKGAVKTFDLTITTGADFSLVNTNYNGNDNPISYPEYNEIMAMIYIGI